MNDDDDDIMTVQVSHPSKMIKAACYQLMRSLTIGVSLNADKMQPSAVNSSTSILRQVTHSYLCNTVSDMGGNNDRCCNWDVRPQTAPLLNICSWPRTNTGAGPALALSGQSL